MNNTVRALIFGTAVAAALTLTLDTVTAAEPVRVIRLDPVTVTAHRVALQSATTTEPSIIRLDPVVVIAHRSATIG